MEVRYFFCFISLLVGKRTTKGSEVSGHIKLNISSKVEGERTLTPFHKQYMKLHEVYMIGYEKMAYISHK